ncbi:MAG: type II secretion system protein [Gammaproteobacteria bacterium]|nr:MAG: type II secretion system protein [Gammaproteobacteria bacterium]
MKSRQGGFTLIELVVVITILGILAAFALPRFAGFQGEARLAVINGIAGTMRSAAALAHAKVLAQGSAADADGSITMEGQTVTIVDGYPAEASGGIDAAANIQATGGLSCSTTGGVYVCSYSNVCKVEYDEAASPNAPTVTVTADASNCE